MVMCPLLSWQAGPLRKGPVPSRLPHGKPVALTTGAAPLRSWAEWPVSTGCFLLEGSVPRRETKEGWKEVGLYT